MTVDSLPKGTGSHLAVLVVSVVTFALIAVGLFAPLALVFDAGLRRGWTISLLTAGLLSAALAVRALASRSTGGRGKAAIAVILGAVGLQALISTWLMDWFAADPVGNQVLVYANWCVLAMLLAGIIGLIMARRGSSRD